jgi:hypothetical protein
VLTEFHHKYIFSPYQPLHKHESKKEKKEMIPLTVRSLQVKKEEVSFPSQNKRGKRK